MSNKLDVSLLNNSSVNTSSSLFEAISICGTLGRILIVGADDGTGFRIKFTFCPLLLEGVDGVPQAECNVVVGGVVDDTEFCLRGGPNAGKFTFCPLLLEGVDGVAQAECNVVVGGVVEDPEFCLRCGPNAGKSSWYNLGLEVVVVVEVVGVLGGVTPFLVCDKIGNGFCDDDLVVVDVVVVDDDDDGVVGDGVIALTTFGSVDISMGASVDFFEK